MNIPVLDITGFFFRIRTQVTTLVLRTSAFTPSPHLHLQDTSKLQCVEDFLEGMLGKLKFE
jgi:hypothetical protein